LRIDAGKTRIGFRNTLATGAEQGHRADRQNDDEVRAQDLLLLE
jgi:hypothetical protein